VGPDRREADRLKKKKLKRLTRDRLLTPEEAKEYQRVGSGRDVTVHAESSAEARRTVMEIIPGAVVTGVRRIR
jgi:hypothetical protein